MEKDQVMELEVEVQGHAFYSKGARKVMVKKFNPESFLQTDKPIYLPGQTGHPQMRLAGRRRRAGAH